jgi:hypothetical protein
MCRGNYLPADAYVNHAEKSDATLVEAFKRMQVIEDLEQVDAADEDGEPDEEVSYVHFSSCSQVIVYHVQRSTYIYIRINLYISDISVTIYCHAIFH